MIKNKVHSTKKNLKCFIACAFDRTDVDEIYQKVLNPSLKSLNLKPLRSDIPDHNDDIDDKIIELINDSDFCICDLTYARPSVYYEAGYAAGLNKPVIFTVRKDHFKPKEDDPCGNFKVHFDLQMKNIIDWKDKDDHYFEKRLKSRISLVTKPIMKVYQAQIEKKEADNAFQKLSEIEKIFQIGKKITKIFKDKKYTILDNNISDVKKPLSKYVLAVFKRKKVFVYITNSLSRKLILNPWIALFHSFEDTHGSDIMYISINSSRLNFSYLLPESSKLSQNQYCSVRKDGTNEYITIIHGIKSIIDLEKEILDLI